MKKSIILGLLISVCTFSALTAQVRFGVKGGLTYNDYKDITESGSLQSAWKSQSAFDVGFVLHAKLPLGFAVQPELLYSRKGAGLTLEGDIDYGTFKMDYIEVPVGIQWGIDIFFIRPFLSVTPYISYAIKKEVEILGDLLEHTSWDDTDRFDYGIGLGGGIDIWKFQISAKYNWGFGKISTIKDLNLQEISDKIDSKKNRTFELSLAFLF